MHKDNTAGDETRRSTAHQRRTSQYVGRRSAEEERDRRLVPDARHPGRQTETVHDRRSSRDKRGCDAFALT